MWGRNLNILDVLFVKLKNPAVEIRLPGLPDNVVPLTKMKRKISCQLPNGHIETIHQDQIEVLPDFAMTAYSSQGKTQPFNVIDLTDCHTHLSYYTCFSQSATIAGTVIVGGFNPNIIQGGTSGWLRQEF